MLKPRIHASNVTGARPETELLFAIRLAKDIFAKAGMKSSWEDTSWDISHLVSGRPGLIKSQSVVFRNFDSNKKAPGAPLVSEFIDFAKAYFFTCQSRAKTVSFGYRLGALRALERALIETIGNGMPHNVNPITLNFAESLVRARYSTASAYHYCRELEAIGEYLCKNGAIEIPFQWKTFAPKAKELNRIGEEADARRTRNLPSGEVLDAIASIYNQATEPRDIVLSSLLTLMALLPMRLTEVLGISADCEVEQSFHDDGKYSLRWRSGKGGGFGRKVVPSKCIDLVKDAITRIKSITEVARKNALWHEENPSSFYRDQLPSSFPFMPGTNLKISDALFVFEYGFFSSHILVPSVLIQLPSHSILSNQFGRVATGKVSIFDRFGLYERDGSRIYLRSHQLRHELNTAMMKNGLSQIDIARWSGRKSPLQNRDYDNMTGEDLVAMVKEMNQEDPRLFGEIGKLAQTSPVSYAEFCEIAFPVAHVTPIGFCTHAMASSPCTLFRNCVECSDHVCIKGAKAKLGNLQGLLSSATMVFNRAVEGKQKGDYGASAWVEVSERQIARISTLLSILESDEIPDGALVRLFNPDQISRFQMALSEKRLSESIILESAKNATQELPWQRG